MTVGQIAICEIFGGCIILSVCACWTNYRAMKLEEKYQAELEEYERRVEKFDEIMRNNHVGGYKYDIEMMGR